MGCLAKGLSCRTWRNPYVRTFRGNFLEMGGRLDDARTEYVAAHLLEPENPRFLDNLAMYYVRRGAYDLALDTFADVPDERIHWPSPLKHVFWKRVSGSTRLLHLVKAKAWIIPRR